MELLYLWVEDYKNIKKQEFHFNNRYIFKFEEKNEHELFEFKIKENDTFFSIFDEKNINFTGIIGRNGAGKSTILEFIGNVFNNAMIKTGYILCFRINNKIYIKINNTFSQKNISESMKRINVEDEIIVGEYNQVENKEINFNTLKTFNNLKEINEIIKNIKVIFYSNIFDYRQERKSNENYYNISTNNLLNEYIKNYSYIKSTRNESLKRLEILINDSISNNLNNIKENFDNLKKGLEFVDGDAKLVQMYKLTEFKEQINFLGTINDKKTFNEYLKKEINFPTGIIINISNPFFYLRSFETENIESNRALMRSVQTAENDTQEIILEKFKKKLFLSIYQCCQTHLNNTFFSKIKSKEINIETLEFKELIDVYIKNDVREKFELNTLLIDDLIKNVLELFEKMEINNELQTEIGLSDERKIESFFKIIKNQDKLLESTKNEQEIINYEWNRHMSTGEKELLSLFSRFNKIKEDILQDEALILLDEPDIHMHPEWQRKFLQHFIEYISDNFQGKYHCIITSHSPFLLSNLPKENCIFLDKGEGDEKDICKVVNSDNMQQTFAANIHTLFSDSFFMMSTIGGFAKKEISKIIKELWEEKSILPERQKTIKGIIEIIGESIVKNKLLKKYDERFSKKEFEKNNYIKELEKKVNENEIKNIDDLIEIMQKNLDEVKEKRKLEHLKGAE